MNPGSHSLPGLSVEIGCISYMLVVLRFCSDAVSVFYFMSAYPTYSELGFHFYCSKLSYDWQICLPICLRHLPSTRYAKVCYLNQWPTYKFGIAFDDLKYTVLRSVIHVHLCCIR